MKNFKNLLVFTSVLLVSGIVMVSCSKDEQKVQAPISVIDGRLVFESQEVFNTTLKELLKNQDGLKEWKSQFNYTSLWEAYERITEEEKVQIGNSKSIKGYENVIKIIEDENGELEATPTITNNIHQVIFNHQGIIQIGNHIYKQDYDYLKIITDGDISKLKMLGDVKESNKDLAIEVHPVIHNITLDKGTHGFDHPCQQDWTGGKHRLKGMTSYDNNGIWMSLNACTANYKKSVGVWWLNKACSLELDVHAKYEFNERVGPLYTWETRNENIFYNEQQSNESKIDHTFEHCTFYGNDECFVDTEIMDGTHKSRAECSGTSNNGNSTKTCITTY
jgi:hypothetical protein